MDPKYEFMTAHRVRMIEYARLNQLLMSRRTNKVDPRGKVFVSFGDDLISFGSWIKKLSLSTVDEPDYLQNH